MRKTVLVTGASGTLGPLVVHALRTAGAQVRIFSRRHSQEGPADDVEAIVGDLLTGSGLVEAVSGVDAVVHCATSPPRGAVDVKGTAALVDVARATGDPHFVYISIVGADRIPLGYYRAKVTAEGLVEKSGLPFSILRATQFHQFAKAILDQLSAIPVLLVPGAIAFQPVDAGEVGDRLAAISLSAPVGRAPDFGGPEIRSALDLARGYVRLCRRRRLVIPVPLPGRAAAAFRSGHQLVPDRRVGSLTWEEFLTGCANHSIEERS